MEVVLAMSDGSQNGLWKGRTADMQHQTFRDVLFLALGFINLARKWTVVIRKGLVLVCIWTRSADLVRLKIASTLKIGYHVLLLLKNHLKKQKRSSSIFFASQIMISGPPTHCFLVEWSFFFDLFWQGLESVFFQGVSQGRLKTKTHDSAALAV